MTTLLSCLAAFIALAALAFSLAARSAAKEAALDIDRMTWVVEKRMSIIAANDSPGWAVVGADGLLRGTGNDLRVVIDEVRYG